MGKAFAVLAAGAAIALAVHIWALVLLLNLWIPLNVASGRGSTVVLDRDGFPLRAFADDAGVWRFPAAADEVSPLYLEALLTYEDRWFYTHPGVNPLALIRAFFQDLRAGRVVSGGSTLTMQVVRIMAASVPHRSALLKKLDQVLRAVQLETRLTKTEILNLYLTHAPFGANVEGVRAAALTWLGKDARELTHAEAALLAVLPQAPSRFRPDRHPESAERARNKVLDRMAAFGVWAPETVAMAKQEPVIPLRFPAPLAAPLAARRLKSEHPEAPLVPTFLSGDLQRHVAEVLGSYAAALAPETSGAVMVVDGKTMEVLAYAGSADFASPRRKGYVDMVRAFRSPGSALKPFIYGMAVDAGLIHSHSLLLDVPRIGKDYDPGNFTGGFRGPVTATEALQDSLNLPAVQVLEALGPGNCHDRMRNGGADFSFDGPPNLSLALGGESTTLSSLVTLYASLARNGMASVPRLTPSDPVRDRFLLSPGAAWIVRKMLSRPFPGQEGVARLAGNAPVAWKTGTSYGFRDAWALGLRGHIIAGVWIGRPDGSPSPGQYGAVTALPLLATVLESLDAGADGPMPASVTQQTVCWPSGLGRDQLAAGGQLPDGACVRTHKAFLLDHQIPPTLTGLTGMAAPLVRTLWVDEAGRRASPLCGGTRQRSFAFWPWQAEGFIPKAWRRAERIPEPSPDCPALPAVSAPPIRITSVADGSILRRQPGDAGPAAVPLRALGGRGNLYWFLNRQPLGPGGPAADMPMPEPGAYHLAVMDDTGNADQVSFRVEGGGAFQTDLRAQEDLQAQGDVSP